MLAQEAYNKTFDLLESHHKWFQKSIPLIASENVSSPALREALASDFGHMMMDKRDDGSMVKLHGKIFFRAYKNST